MQSRAPLPNARPNAIPNATPARPHRLARSAAVLALAALLVACGDGYRGYFVWGNKPPQNEDDDSGLVVVITKAQLSSSQTVTSSSSQQQAMRTASAAVKDELARLFTTDEIGCEPGAVVYELQLQSRRMTERYRSSNWYCKNAPAVPVKDYISASDLARFAALLGQEQ